MARDRYRRSEEWYARALRVTPGASQTRSKGPAAFPVAYPRALARGRGAHVWDVDGHRYVDWIAGLGAVSLGYGHPVVDRAVRRQLTRGVSFSLPHPLEALVADELATALRADAPACAYAEQVRWTKTGSEATEGAMLIARRATGRDVVVSIGYHGWHASHAASLCPRPEGVPFVYTQVHRAAPYNGALEELASELVTRRVAAILVEPTRDEPPREGYLEGIRALCTRTGALLIFDEMVTGFRWRLGGGASHFGVQPDLACFGKGLANGFPLAAIVGPRALMQYADGVSGTFGGEALSLAAAQAVLKVYQTEDVIGRFWATGRVLQRGISVLDRHLQSVGAPVHPRLVLQDPERLPAFLEALARRGILCHPLGGNIMAAHDEAAVAQTLEACRAVVREVC